MHPLVWFAWAASLMLVALTTRNPLYLVLILVITRAVHALAAGAERRRGLSVARFAAIVIPLSALLNALTSHLGDTVLFVVPGQLPLLSGPVTVEALAYGAISGLMLTTVLSIFATLNAAVAPREWMRFAPRAYQSVALTTSIALGFAPQMSARLREVRDAQAIRGHRVKGVRDWLPLWMPLLTGSLEQSMQVSEAMVARGFGAARAERSMLRTQAALVVGLALVLSGWLAQFVPGIAAAAPTAGLAAGALVVLWAVRAGARDAAHTTYREQPWHARDVAVGAAGALAAGALLLAPALGAGASLHYSPYPSLMPPNVTPWVVLALLAFAAPALAARRSGTDLA